LLITKSRCCCPASCETGAPSTFLSVSLVSNLDRSAVRCLSLWENLDADSLARCREHTEALVEEFDVDILWDQYSIIGQLIVCFLLHLCNTKSKWWSPQPFTNNFPRADIYKLLSPDLLHQIIKGAFKDHLVDWVKRYLKKTHGTNGANIILDDIDRRYVFSESTFVIVVSNLVA